MLIGAKRTPPVRRLESADAFLLYMIAACIVLAVVLQGIAFANHIRGPIVSLGFDYVATPATYAVPWAGLLVAMVGLDKRWRILSLSIAAVLDLTMAGVRFLFLDNRFAIGNGPLIVVTVLAVTVAVRWSGRRRTLAMRGIAVGVLLILAQKVAETWLKITSLSRPMVLDEYVALADNALGNPAWHLGRLIRASEPVGNVVLHGIYSELALVAVVVACWQLRRIKQDGWPSHYLVRTFIVMGIIGPIFYVLFPVVGPMFVYGADGAGWQLSNSWPDTVPSIGLPAAIPFDDVTPRNCMPSMHTAWALSIFIHSRGGPRWLRLVGALWLVGTLLATLGFGYHYGVDLVAGAVLCLTVEAALRDPERGWGWFRIRLVVPGAVLFVALLLAYRFLAEPIGTNPAIAGPILIGSLVGLSVAFYATFFAKPGTVLAGWGRRTAD